MKKISQIPLLNVFFRKIIFNHDTICQIGNFIFIRMLKKLF